MVNKCNLDYEKTGCQIVNDKWNNIEIKLFKLRWGVDDRTSIKDHW